MTAANATPAPALALVGIAKRFGSTIANDAVSLAVWGREVHAVIGENGAGKTTLMNCVFGLVSPDAGQIEVRGRPVSISNPRDALDLGIGMVHQHPMLVPDMTVAENVALGATGRRLSAARLDRVAQAVREIAGRVGLSVDPTARIEDLSMSGRQRAEIVKLLLRGAKILILDEPTSVLTPREWEQLADALRVVSADGTAVIFITHKLDEVFAIADRYTVLRDGRVAEYGIVAEVTKAHLARQMVGREVALRARRPPTGRGAPILEARELKTAGAGDDSLNGVNFALHEGEVVGVAGVDGNGQRALVEALTGVIEPTDGEIRIGGSVVDALTPDRFEALGGAVIPEDSQQIGLALDLSVLDNVMLRDFAKEPFARHGILRSRAMRAYVREVIDAFNVRTPSLDTPVRRLSGGNQQKVVLARELKQTTRVLIAAQPTRGLDVGAAEDVYEVLRRFKLRGGATLLISAELDEILALADRIAVLVGGCFADIVPAQEASQEVLGLLMSGKRPDHSAAPVPRGAADARA